MKQIMTICCGLLFANISLAIESQLPPPFASHEITTSTSGTGTWEIDQHRVEGSIYLGRVLVTGMYSRNSLFFDAGPGLLKFHLMYTAGGSGTFDNKRSYSWSNDGKSIGSSECKFESNEHYKEIDVRCRFDEVGVHCLSIYISMSKQASKYYVQGPRMVISNIEWQPDYVDTNVDGNSVRIDGKWIRDNVSTNILHDCRYDYSAVLDRVEANGYTVLGSYIAGLTPTNSNSKLLADIHMVDGVPVIEWTPHLDNRVYTIYGKTNLADKVWHSPTNSSSRFFKVGVTLP